LSKEFEFDNLNLEFKVEEIQQQHLTKLGDGRGARRGKSKDLMRQCQHQHRGE